MFLIVVHLNATNYCRQFENSFIETDCVNEIVECVTDGDSFKWCSDNISNFF